MLDNLILVLYAIPALALAISLHEMMHALVAYKLGDDLAHSRGRISLNPLHHIDPLTTIALPLVLILLGMPPFAAAKPVPINTSRLKWGEFGMALVGVAGPLTNLGLAIFFAVMLKIFDPSALSLMGVGQIAANASFVSIFFIYCIMINVGLFVFNMIPWPPLDGSRLLYALVPESVQKIMMQIESYGFAAILIFMFLGFQLISPMIGTAQMFIVRLLAG